MYVLEVEGEQANATAIRSAVLAQAARFALLVTGDPHIKTLCLYNAI